MRIGPHRRLRRDARVLIQRSGEGVAGNCEVFGQKYFGGKAVSGSPSGGFSVRFSFLPPRLSPTVHPYAPHASGPVSGDHLPIGAWIRSCAIVRPRVVVFIWQRTWRAECRHRPPARRSATPTASHGSAGPTPRSVQETRSLPCCSGLRGPPVAELWKGAIRYGGAAFAVPSRNPTITRTVHGQCASDTSINEGLRGNVGYATQRMEPPSSLLVPPLIAHRHLVHFQIVVRPVLGDLHHEHGLKRMEG